ncbi:sporulation protein YlmC with PRC-barrel domain [Rhodopseudomonas rhenobacensis]|uniref:Sporulation protein YlmC with PRC-barrel domain n=1 Tax=Rhodopseudomonas rhenobacensis TaxID=87461 RepID=A0A7W7Z536_9BRAD|nr:PRC-barrel domain-containing protein [Rhodopseudomonas rhenobacensis]MBB5048173.1 sporulation protein YlmC with PRC-barrel domain [Rhodopseudomonas rhenobacensis]
MFAKSITAGLLGTALLATAAVAQTPSATTTTPAPSASASSGSSMSHQGQWRSSKLIGINVYNDNNESLGEISELLVDQSGKVQAAVIGVGGFLGMGERNIAIPFEKIKWVNEPLRSAANNRPAGSAATGTAAGTGTAASTTTGSAASTASSSSANKWYPDHAVFNASKDELKALPEFKYSN